MKDGHQSAAMAEEPVLPTLFHKGTNSNVGLVFGTKQRGSYHDECGFDSRPDGTLFIKKDACSNPLHPICTILLLHRKGCRKSGSFNR